MKLGIAILGPMLAILGCTTNVIKPNFEYASTNLGVYNSGLLSVGQLFVWDTKEDTLTRLDEIPFPTKPDTKSWPTTLVASDISSVTFGAGLDAGIVAKATAAIKSNVSIQVHDASREDYRNTIGLIANEINRKKEAAEDVDTRWLLREAADRGSPLRYVLVRGLVTSDRAELVSNRTKGGALSITVPGGKSGEVKIDLSNESLARCTGKQSPCFLSFQVLKAYYNSKGNYDFEPVRGVTNAQLGDLLKTL